MQYDPYSIGTNSNIAYGKSKDTAYADNIIKLFPVEYFGVFKVLTSEFKVQRLERNKIMKFIFSKAGGSYSYLDEKVIGYLDQGKKFYEVKFTLSDRNVARVTNLLIKVVENESGNLQIQGSEIVSPEMMKIMEPEEEGPVKDTISNYLKNREYRT